MKKKFRKTEKRYSTFSNHRKEAFMKKFTITLLMFLMFTCFLHAKKPKVIHMHVAKSAGTTVKALLFKQYMQREIYPYRFSRFKNALNLLPDISEPLASGHFPMNFLEKKVPGLENYFLFTVFRDPVERVLSHARYKTLSYQRRGKISRDREIDHRQLPANYLCRMLTSDPSLKGKELLTNCIENLEKFDLIIFQDDPDEFREGIELLCKKLHFRLPRNIPVLNSTEKKPVLQILRDEIAKRNSLDIALYKYAKKHFSLKNASL